MLFLKIILTFFNSTVILHYTVKRKKQIRARTIVPVYPQPNDEESFWLFKVRSVGDVNVHGQWLNKINETDHATTYSLGGKDFVFVKNIMKPKKYVTNFYLIKANFDSGGELKLQSDHVRYFHDLTESGVK